MSLVVDAPTKHERLLGWVETMAELCEPDTLHWCDGSQAEYEHLCRGLVVAGIFIELDPDRRPGSYWATTDPSDVARVEDRTFICSEQEGNAGPTNNWMDPAEMRETVVSAANQFFGERPRKDDITMVLGRVYG